MSIIVKKPWTSQPQVPVGIDWSNPICKGIQFVWVPANNQLLPVSSPTYTVNQKGRGINTNGSSSYLYQSISSMIDLQECSVTAILTPTLITTASAVAVALGNSGNDNPLFMLGQGSTTNNLSFRTRDTAGTDVEVQATDSAWASGVPAVCSGTRSSSGGYQRVFIAGRQIATASPATAGAVTYDRFAIGGLLRSAFALAYSGTTSLVILHKRALSAGEIKSLADNPWQIFAPLKRVIYAPAISGATAALTGTVTTATEADIVAGGKTIILTLTGDTWVAAGATFDAQRQNIINGLTSAQSEATGWNLVPKALQGVAGVVRTSDTVVTITLDAQATYNITATETITATIPSTALTGAVAIVAAPTFSVTASASFLATWARSNTLIGGGMYV